MPAIREKVITYRPKLALTAPAPPAGSRQSRGFVTFFPEWHRFPPIFSTADASPTLGMRWGNSSGK